MRLLLLLVLLAFCSVSRGGEPLLKPNDVVALVGGEDIVVAAELGHLEALVQRALPDYKLKFRSFAWEGDTVFEQRRDLNYPKLEAQLEKIGATVVIAQFGQLESLAGAEGLNAFVSAYETLIRRLQGSGTRRVLLMSPNEWRPSNVGFDLASRAKAWAAYAAAVEELAGRLGPNVSSASASKGITRYGNTGARDGMHVAEAIHPMYAASIAGGALGKEPLTLPSPDPRLVEAARAKNRLWFHYYRPQNWAFLAGDRTNQPSSRDHKDLSKRWFPSELEQFVPLIEAKEQEIWELAAKLNR